MHFSIAQNNVQDFLNQFEKPEEGVVKEPVVPADSPVQAALNALSNPPTPKVEETKIDEPVVVNPKKEGTKEEIEAALNKTEDAVKSEGDKALIKDVSKFAEILKEKSLLIPYDDGTLPSTEEEMIDALAQSSQFNAEQTVNNLWKEKVESLPPSLLRIHEYAANGVTTAEQLAHFTNSLAQTERIGSLDPKNPEDQEQIVLLQLMNTGLDEKSAREEVEDLKTRNLIEGRAAKFFPSLKKTYEDNTRRLEIEQNEKAEAQQRYVQTNSANVTYFLEKDTEYLPFRLDPKDRAYKAEIFNLAAQEVDRTESGDPIFGWQRYLENLQYGTEEEYKKFMKIMAFAANDKKYDESVSKKVKTSTEVKEFKKINTNAGGIDTRSSEKTEPVMGIKRPRSNSWSV